MAGTSDSKQPDDIKFHLETIVAADDARKIVPEVETEDERIERESVVLRPKLRERVDRILSELNTQVPGLTAAETAKLLASRAGRDALKAGRAALARVDDHLQSVTEQRNPVIGKKYGVHGENPESFGGVLRALELSGTENERLKGLPDGDPERDLVFTPLVAREVERARDALTRVLGTRTTTRASLSRGITVKDKTRDEALKLIAAVREQLYANLADRKQDDDLRDYGFRPIEVGGRPSREEKPEPEPPVPVEE